MSEPLIKLIKMITMMIDNFKSGESEKSGESKVQTISQTNRSKSMNYSFKTRKGRR